MSDNEENSDRSPTLTPPRKLPKKGGWTRKKEEHNIAYSVADHLADLLKEVVTDSKLIKEIELKRTKLQSFAAVEPHKILKPSQTRWLSLLSVVERILEQWEALRLFFIDFTTNPAHRARADKSCRYCTVLLMLQKISTKLPPPKLKNDITWKILSCQSYKFLNLHQRSPIILEAISQHLCHLWKWSPRIIAPADYAKKQIIDNQWRTLPNARARHPQRLNEISEPDKFWAQLLKTEDFSELAHFALSTLSLPHANADCERVFSKVNLIKTDLRNRLTVETVNGTLLAAESAKGLTRTGNCVNFEPTKEMYSRMTKDKIYGRKHNNIEDVPDIMFGEKI
ncbi:hypothetical protein EVAR_13225_1 [Eumeta japonica]|uniref:HAT C-terminal dimerisation domain-containing protein n=1 Tax=Eumeta variegata TaxID=151549 RepID=A0A4C1TSG3_EUMVA|nr:hypothetical protein EVAR_13225_1 [Eumeta japonica]